MMPSGIPNTACQYVTPEFETTTLARDMLKLHALDHSTRVVPPAQVKLHAKMVPRAINLDRDREGSCTCS